MLSFSYFFLCLERFFSLINLTKLVYSLKTSLDVMPLVFFSDLSAFSVPCTNSVIASFILFGKYFYDDFLSAESIKV